MRKEINGESVLKGILFLSVGIIVGLLVTYLSGNSQLSGEKIYILVTLLSITSVGIIMQIKLKKQKQRKR